MMALKLCGAEKPRRKWLDLADVQRLLEGCQHVSIHDWDLTERQLSEVEEIRKMLKATR